MFLHEVDSVCFTRLSQKALCISSPAGPDSPLNAPRRPSSCSSLHRQPPVSESRLPSCGEIKGNCGAIVWGWVAFLETRISAYITSFLFFGTYAKMPESSSVSSLRCLSLHWWPGDPWSPFLLLVTYGSYAVWNHVICRMLLCPKQRASTVILVPCIRTWAQEGWGPVWPGPCSVLSSWSGALPTQHRTSPFSMHVHHSG